MNEFVDDKLQIVVDKLGEKKALTAANNSCRVVLDKLGENIQGLLKENAGLNENYNKEYKRNQGLNKECDKLDDELTFLREKIEGIRISENATINNMREHHDDLKADNAHHKQQFNLQKNLWQDDLKNQRLDIKELEEMSRQAMMSLKDYHSKYKY